MHTCANTLTTLTSSDGVVRVVRLISMAASKTERLCNNCQCLIVITVSLVCAMTSPEVCGLFKECCSQIVARMKMKVLNEKLEQYVINEKLHGTVCDACF